MHVKPLSPRAYASSDISTDSLVRRAARFPIRGPMSVDDAWDGIALADYAHREQMPLPAEWERAIDRAAKLVRHSNTLAAFRMAAVTTVAQYYLGAVIYHLVPARRRPDEELVAAFERLFKAKKARRR